MDLSGGNLILLCLGALILAAMAVVLDRLNFPQRPFRPKRVLNEQRPYKDRTGAHIVDVDSIEEADARLQD